MRLSLAICAASFLCARAAHAEPAARFIYLRGKGTESCPAEGDVRQAVQARLGYDPFSSYASATMFAEVSARDGPGFSANLKLVDADNAVRGDRALKTQGPCADLMEAMALTISIAIDPESATREGLPPGTPPAERAVEPRAPRDAPSVPSVPDEPVKDVVAETAAEKPTRAFAVSLGPLVSVGSAPGVALGGLLAVDGQYGLLYGGVEGRADAPASASADTIGRVSSSLTTGALFLGLRRGAVFLAAVGALGEVRASGSGVTESRDVSALIANVGLRAGLAVPLTSRFELRGRLEGLGNPIRHTLAISGQSAYRYPALSANVSVGLAVRFW